MALFVIADIALIVACLPLSFAMELAAGYFAAPERERERACACACFCLFWRGQ
jgi:hypothetical protein